MGKTKKKDSQDQLSQLRKLKQYATRVNVRCTRELNKILTGAVVKPEGMPEWVDTLYHSLFSRLHDAMSISDTLCSESDLLISQIEETKTFGTKTKTKKSRTQRH